jgi:DNA-binding beta-propeller fold protein YncE
MGDGGWNQNERMAGGGDEGVSVETGEIAIDPTGRYLISKSDRALIHAELESGAARELDGLRRTSRVTFDRDGTSLFLTRGVTRLPQLGQDQTSGELVRYDVAQERELWTIPVTLTFDWQDEAETSPRLDVTEDDRFVIATYLNRVDVIDAAAGRVVKSIDLSRVVDVDIMPDQDRIAITTRHTWQTELPETVIELHALDGQGSTEIRVPNCSSELTVSQDGRYGFIAPTSCEKDPVSVIDFETGRFVRNLPGFGPVALADEGALAIAFIDAENIDEQLFDDPQQIPNDDVRYHLMLIDTSSLRFDVIALGDLLPRYAVTPDGKLLLIDADTLWADGRIRLLDVGERALVPITGPSLHLHHYAVTRDSSKVFLLDDGLYSIDLPNRSADAAQIDFTPTDLNITPDDATLVLRKDDTTLWLYDVARSQLGRQIVLSEN